MPALATTDFVIPVEVADSVWKAAQKGSTIARLSGAKPQKFGPGAVMTLTAAPKAELVGEGAEKSPTPATYAPKTVTPRKLQVTLRMTDEVLWADEDHQLGILMDAFENAGLALGRALDIVGYHKMNPLTGNVATSVTEGVIDTTNSATLANGKYDQAIEAAAGLVIADGFTPTGVAFDPTCSFGIASQRDNDGRRLYPEMGFGLEIASFAGMNAAVSDTVSAKNEAASATDVLAFVGQFDAIRWGVQRDIRAHLIEFGDPDGLGDLQRLNQVAIRAEIVYGIGIMNLNAFAKVMAQ